MKLRTIFQSVIALHQEESVYQYPNKAGIDTHSNIYSFYSIISQGTSLSSPDRHNWRDRCKRQG